MNQRASISLVIVLGMVGVVLGQNSESEITPILPSPAMIDPGAPAQENGRIGPAELDTGKSSHFWFDADFLLWWFKGSPVPVALVTTTSNTAALPLAGIGEPGTSPLLGIQNLRTGAHPGARFSAGLWLDTCHQIGVEASYFVLATEKTVQTVVSAGQPGSPVLAVPFINEDTVAEGTFLLAAPGTLAGSAALSLTNRFQGAEILAAVQTCANHNFRCEILFGFRYLDLVENLNFTTTSTGLAGPNTGLILDTQDQFDMRNQFFGCQVGARANYRLGDWQVTASAKLAMGPMFQTEQLNGFAVTNFFNAPVGGPFAGVLPLVVPGSGLFVQPSNLGRFNRYRITVVPEVNVTAGYQVTSYLRIFGGYDFLYLSKVLRPGYQINTGINVSQTVQNAIAGNAVSPGILPTATFLSSDFWAQGLHTGIELRF